MPRAPSKKTAPEEEHDPVRAGQPSIGDWSATLAGVSIAWLHNAFRMDRQTVKKRLAKLDPIGNGHAGQPVYDFVQAAAYLVKPKVNVAEYIKGLKPTDLPVILQDQYWASQLKRQQWEQRAGKLWHTDDVIEVFGRTFLVIKDTMNLWVENLAEASRGTLTAEQRKVLVGLVDGLQTDIHRNLLEMQAHHSTRNQLAELDDIMDTTAEVRAEEDDLIG